MHCGVGGAGGGFVSRLADLLDTVEVRKAQTQVAREAIYRLRYRAYRKEGVIAANRRRKFHDGFDESVNCSIFGVYIDHRLVSSVRIHIATAATPTSPAVAVFPDILAPYLAMGAVVDPTRLVTDPDSSTAFPGLPYLTVRLGFMASEHFDAALGLATVRQEHRAFYRRTFMLDQLSEPRTYPGLRKPIVMLGKRYADVKQAVLTRYPFMASTNAERLRLFGDGHIAELPPVVPQLPSNVTATAEAIAA